ncbi:initiation factor 2 [Ramicandelaber brevisporus]|nr:initiation factor 2 [Ramicandelaber brevisporus]
MAANKDQLERQRKQERHQRQQQQYHQSSSKSSTSKNSSKRPDRPKDISQVVIPDAVTVSMLADLLGINSNSLLRKIVRMGMLREEGAARNDTILCADDAGAIVLEYGITPILPTESNQQSQSQQQSSTSENDENILVPRPQPTDLSQIPSRPPVVTIMGHVDHGKTTLLDTLRKSRIVDTESGGITQHIGAFVVPLSNSNNSSISTITFIDTPGHSAFQAMRARGANCTDIVILVVAADDGVMPQTIEAIKHAQRAGVPMIVAINKCDKPGVNTERIKYDLMSHGIQLEDLGGDVPAVEISALKNTGIDNLIETVVALAEINDMRAEQDGMVEAAILESSVQKGIGNQATALVKRGTLKNGDILVAGTTWCRVRSMVNDLNQTVKEALPGTPVRLSGWDSLPNAGEVALQATKGESQAKQVISARKEHQRRVDMVQEVKAISEKRRLDLLERMKFDGNGSAAKGGYTGGPRFLNLVIKGDVSGSIEAIVDALNAMPYKRAKPRIISVGVGDIVDSDVTLAQSSQATVICFKTKCGKPVQKQAQSAGVNVKSYNVIYHLMDDIKDMLAGLLDPVIEREVKGEANVIQVFEITLSGSLDVKGHKKGDQVPVAGCKVSNGVIKNDRPIKVLRNGKAVFEGKLAALRIVKKVVTEVGNGSDCGIMIDGFDTIKSGDIIQSIEEKSVPAQLT